MKIITCVVNNPIFIEIQYYTLKKYFKGDYEFIVFNDAKDFPDFTNSNDITIKEKIIETCNKLNIQCINIPNAKHKLNRNSNIRVADSMNFILEYQKKNPDKYLLIDSDMFLVDYFDINKYIQYDCAIVLQSRNNFRTNYFWNGFYYFDMTKMKDLELLDWNCVDPTTEFKEGCDTGGCTQKWLSIQMQNKNMPNTNEIRWTNNSFHTDNIYFIKHLWSCTWSMEELPNSILENNKKLIDFLQKDVRNKNGKFFCEMYDNVFLHYRAGGNWNGEGMKFHHQLSQLLKECLVDNEE